MEKKNRVSKSNKCEQTENCLIIVPFLRSAKFSGSNRSNDIAHARFIQSEQFLKVHTHGYRIECRFESRDIMIRGSVKHEERVESCIHVSRYVARSRDKCIS